ncbi:uncharacterized protein UTRI_02557 [Ustilago trichophora]|uniref:Transcription factor CBF/NF-Y/archaeal histone domain-containing protein n=1 Tax=Ustilago trichophora TaxID=86804 RepID=A0A5C3E9M0_9BASI|nr:uncharacterized protein UTRI_02557 [Ustilago trichophora]
MSRPESPASPSGARVARIIKADRDVDICSKEATFLISIATEIFVKKLTDEAYTNAKLDKRKHIFYKDLSRAVQTTEYLEFLKDAIPTPVALSVALEARQDKMHQKQTEENMILEGTLQDEDEEDEEEDEEDEEEAEEEEADDQEAEEQQEAEEEQPAEDQQEAFEPPSKHTSKKAAKATPAANAHDDDEAMEEEEEDA